MCDSVESNNKIFNHEHLVGLRILADSKNIPAVRELHAEICFCKGDQRALDDNYYFAGAVGVGFRLRRGGGRKSHSHPSSDCCDYSRRATCDRTRAEGVDFCS